MYYNSRHNHSNSKYSKNLKIHLANPSNRYRLKNYSLPNLLAPFYNQNLLIDNPSNVIFYSGGSGISSNSCVEIPNTGECFNFLDSELDVYTAVIDEFIDDHDGKSDYKSRLSADKPHQKHSKTLDDDDIQLFGSIEKKLSKFKLKDHPCDLCSKNGFKSLFDDENISIYQDSQGNTFLEPCPHTSLTNIPLIQPFSRPIKGKSDGSLSEQNDSKTCKLTHRVCYSDLKLIDEPIKTVRFNLENINVDHLLTYNRKTDKSSQPGHYEVIDISELVENRKVLNDLSPIKTSSLREVLLNSSENKNEVILETDTDSFGTYELTKTPVISLRDYDVDDNKMQQWTYPTRLASDTKLSQKLPSFRKEDTLGSTTADDDNFNEIQEYLHNSDISVDSMIEKYNELRKSDSSKEALRALKHLICVKLNKQKIYYKGNELKAFDDETQDSLFDKILNNINRVDQIRDSELIRDDDSTLYTYSSLSLSTYDSVEENLTFGVSDNDLLCEEPDLIHINTLDAYGWLTVTDEDSRNQHKILYCELVGSKFSMYSASYKANFKSISSEKPLICIYLNDCFTLVRKKDPKNNKICLKLKGTVLPLDNGKQPNAKQSRDSLSNKTGSVSLRLDADTQNELINWFTFLVSRSSVKSFFTVLGDYKVKPFNNTLYFLLYPKRKELIFNRLPYIRECEKQIYNMFIKHPYYYVDFSMRNMFDSDLIHHMSNWIQPVTCVNFSLNELKFSFNPQLLVDYINNNNITKMFLDNNPIEEGPFSNLLVAASLKTKLDYISFRGCRVYESFISTLKRINRSNDTGKLVIDLRQCELSPDVENFARGYPLNNIQIVIEFSYYHLQEYEMEYFIDTKNLTEISMMGSIISGRLLSTQWRVRKTFKWPFSKQKNDDSVDVYFEYKAPYLIWHNWFPKNKRFSFKKNVESTEASSKLTESQAVFVKNVKLTRKEESDWLMIQGKIPEKFKSTGKDMKIVVKGYTDTATRRWYEVMRRWVAGIQYVEYLQRRPATVACKHILSFCSRVDTQELVMNGFPAERKFLMRFLTLLSGQTSLKSISFSNMSLDSTKLQFENCVLSDMALKKLDWSFNSIRLDEDDNENLGLLNALLPKITVHHYDISHNPLGDSICSSKLFFRILELKPEKISMNYCALSTVFLTKLTSALTKIGQKFESLRSVELEGNHFEYEDVIQFIEVISIKFPYVKELRLYDSVEDDKTQDLIKLYSICNFERVSKDEPEVGDFTRVSHVKKMKNTTRQSFLHNTNN